MIDILCHVDVGGKVPGIIEITEFNYRVHPPDPHINPRTEFMEIGGKTVVKGGNAPDYIYFWFDQNEIYFQVMSYDFPTEEEAIKVVESMLE